jgi:MFS family permease
LLPSVLRIPSFRALWLGQAISQLGDAFYYVIFMFMVSKITGSLVMVGYVGALETLPFLLFGPYAGVLADRIDRRRIMLASDLLSGLFLSMLAVTIAVSGKPPVWCLLVTPFMLSSVRCFFAPAKSAAIPSLVPIERVLEANAISSTTQTVMPLISLSLSASVLSLLYTLSPLWFYLSAVSINATSFLVSAAFISRLPEVRPHREDAHEAHPFTDFKLGLYYIWGRHELKVLTALLTVFRLSVAPFFVVYLAANAKWFGGKPQSLVWFEFSFFLGMVVSSAAMTRQKPARPLYWFASGLAVCGISVGAMAVVPTYWNFIFCNVVAGLAIPAADIPVMTYLQVSVPDAFRGRVNSVREMISMGVMPVGSVFAGFMVARFGLAIAFYAMGIGMVGGCLFGLLDGRFRNARLVVPAGPLAVEDRGTEVAFIA